MVTSDKQMADEIWARELDTLLEQGRRGFTDELLRSMLDTEMRKVSIGPIARRGALRRARKDPRYQRVLDQSGL